MTLWLASMKPKNSRSEPPSSKVIEVDKQETFNWEVAPAGTGEQDITPAPEEVRAEPDIVVTASDATENTPVVAEELKKDVIDSVSVSETVVSAETLPAESVATIPAELMSADTLKKTVTIPVKEHIVQSKETLYAIARLYKVGVMDLVQWNDLDLQQGIKIGQTLRVTEPQEIAKDHETAPVSEIEHVVKPSDTVYSIARKYGVTIKELMDWNSKKDFTLAVGERLKIYPR
jgi:membrane-bound lytic murein transglycosylase D